MICFSWTYYSKRPYKISKYVIVISAQYHIIQGYMYSMVFLKVNIRYSKHVEDKKN